MRDLAIRLMVIVGAALIATLLILGLTALDEMDESPSAPIPIPSGSA